MEVNAVVFDDQDWCSQTLLLYAFGLGYSFEVCIIWSFPLEELLLGHNAFGLGYSFEVCIIWSSPLEELLLGHIERYFLLFPSH